MKELIRKYYILTKPERTITNILTAIAGYLFASRWQIEVGSFAALIFGLALVIASACVFNNYVDKDIDVKMERTKQRALPSGEISALNAISFGTILGITGFGLLIFTNWLTIGVVALAFFGYVVAYGWSKRHTMHSTLVGTVPGGASLVAGYTAFSDKFDLAAASLFLIMLTWQMVHFYAIAIYRRRDYAAAGIPVISVVRGAETTRQYMFVYLILFIIACASLVFVSQAGYIYLILVLALGFYWLWQTISAKKSSPEAWARGVFRTSLSVLLILAVAISIGSVLP